MVVTRKTWDEFGTTGLLLIINQLLHVFGWSIVVVVEGSQITDAYPARVKCRGFDEKATETAYIRASEYMVDNAKALLSEAKGVE